MPQYLDSFSVKHNSSMQLYSQYESHYGSNDVFSPAAFLMILGPFSLLALMPICNDFLSANSFNPFSFLLAAIGSLLFLGFLVGLKFWLVGRRVRQGKSVPAWLMSPENRFALEATLLIEKVSMLTDRWNRYRKMYSLGVCEKMQNEEEVYAHLLELQREAKRHADIADTFLNMKKGGDLDEMDSGDMIAVHLERIRETEDKIRRQLNGVTHHINSPLQAEANAVALEQELREGVKAGMRDPIDQKKRAAQAKAAQTTGR